MTLNLDQLQVSSFETSSLMQTSSYAQPDGMSWPDVCTCIDICLPSEDIYCSGGCPPQYPQAAY
ncbi:MAG TPA: hypothetical protein VF746_23600 [Longimicrobium sp.]